ncbi:MAG: hypothetical protein WA941_09455 [Nitrososphaeraceae archaeon]
MLQLALNLGIIGIVDTIKENAKEAIDLLKSMRMKVIIGTGGDIKRAINTVIGFILIDIISDLKASTTGTWQRS